MASYTRQSSFADGDTITAALFNNEFNQLVNAFHNSTGHKHDGTTAEGPVIGLIGDAGETSPNNKVLIDTTNNYIEFYVEVSSSAVQQLYIADGAVVPVTDNDIDLGTSSLEFKDAYFDGTVTTDALVADTADINGGSVDGATLGTNSAITQAVIDNININGTTIGHTSDTDLLTLTSGVLTVAGEVDATSLDISGDADIDGTLEADAITVDGTALNEYIADTVGAMVSSNTESGITVAYEDGDNTLDFTVGTLNQDTTGTADNITVSANNSTDETVYPIFVDGATGSQGAESDTGLTYNPSSGLLTTTLLAGTLNTAAQTNITSLGTLTALTVDNIAIDGAVIGHTSDTDLITLSSGVVTVAGEVDATSLDISGNADIDGTLEADAITVDGTALNEYIADTIGAMVSSNTETGIAVTYEDGDNTLDFVIGTLNQDTTGTAAIATSITASANNSTDETVYPTFVDGATGTQGIETDTGFTYNPSSGLLTISGELDAGSLDISGNADIDGTLEADAITVDGTALNEYIADTIGAMVSSNTETGITVTYEDGDNTLDFAVGTLNQDTTGTADNITVSANNSTDETVYPIFVDGATGSQGAESDTGFTYNPSSGLLTISGELDAGSLDISGDADIDGTLEADAITVNGTTLAEYIADTAGAMFSSNTESGITVTYQDADNTVDLAVDAAQTGITSLLATDIKIGEDDQTKIDFETADEIHFYAANVEQVYLGDNIFGPQSDSDVDLGTTGVRWKDAYVDSITVTGEVDAASLDISGNIDVDGTANLDNTDIDGTLNTSGVVTCQTSANISQVALTSSSNATAWDAAAAANAYYATSENTTFSAPSNATEGAIISVEIAQGGTARTVAWNTVFEFAASTAPTITATANKTDILTFRYNGSVWQEIGRVQNMAQT